MTNYEHEELLAEFGGDGCSNEFQRAAEAFRIAYRFRDDRAAGRKHCAEDGLFRIAVSSPVHGPCDEVAGYNWRVLPCTFCERADVYDWLGRQNPAWWDDGDLEVLEPEVLGPPLPPAPVAYDEVPF